MLCELDFRKAVNKSSGGAWRCVTVEQTECECWNAITVLLCACELPRYLIKCNFWSRRSGMDSEASVFKLSGCWCFWTVAHAESSRWFFFSPSVSGVSLMGLSGSRRIWLAFCRKGECGLVEGKGWRDKLISLCKDSRDPRVSVFVGDRGLLVGLHCWIHLCFAPEKIYQSTADPFSFLWNFILSSAWHFWFNFFQIWTLVDLHN